MTVDFLSGLRRRIIQQIVQHGPIPVSQYVRACLYDPDYGFYMRSGGRSGGRSGHFLTAPEVGPLFGEVIARALDAWWIELDKPLPFHVIDWGAGPGTLARSVLAANPLCVSSDALRWVAVELSPAQRSLHLDQVTSVAYVEEALPNGADSGVILANELLDNLPFDIVQRTETGWNELRVTISSANSEADGGDLSLNSDDRRRSARSRRVDEADGGYLSLNSDRIAYNPTDRSDCGGDRSLSGFGFVNGECKIDEESVFSLIAVPISADDDATESLPDDVEIGTCLPLQRESRCWIAQAHDILGSGWVVALDYFADVATMKNRKGLHKTGCHGNPEGFYGNPLTGIHNYPGCLDGNPEGFYGNLAEGFGWLRTHRHHENSFSWLTEPGSCDITVDVDLQQVQADYQATTETLADFLCKHGIDDLVNEGRATWNESAGIGDLAALKARSRVNEAAVLLDPKGFGGFQVLTWHVHQ